MVGHENIPRATATMAILFRSRWYEAAYDSETMVVELGYRYRGTIWPFQAHRIESHIVKTIEQQQELQLAMAETDSDELG